MPLGDSSPWSGSTLGPEHFFESRMTVERCEQWVPIEPGAVSTPEAEYLAQLLDRTGELPKGRHDRREPVCLFPPAFARSVGGRAPPRERSSRRRCSSSWLISAARVAWAPRCCNQNSFGCTTAACQPLRSGRCFGDTTCGFSTADRETPLSEDSLRGQVPNVV